MKKGLAIVLTGTFVLGMTTGAFAQTGVPVAEVFKAPVIGMTQNDKAPIKAPAINYMMGTITKVSEDNGVTSLEVKAQDNSKTMIFHLSDQTFLIDAANGLPLDLAKRTGDTVAVYYGPAVTMSIPAQSTAVTVVGNISGDTKTPLYAQVEAVEKMANGDLKITTDGGSRIVTLTGEMPISPYLTKNIVTLADVKVGSELLLWYDVMAMSMPAQATANKAVILPSAQAEAVAPTATTKMVISMQAGVISINGQEVVFENEETLYQKDNGDVMVPVRLLAEKLGYDVLWNNGSVILQAKDAAQNATLTVGDLNYGKNKMLIKLASAPELVDGKIYVPTGFLADALEIEVVINNSNV